MSTTIASTSTPPEVAGYRSIWLELCKVAIRQDWIEAGGISTRFVEAGQATAPPVVMLHGTGGHWETWAANLGAYSEHFRCIAFDMVGNGFSTKPDVDYDVAVYVAHVQAVMDALDVDRAVLVGTSLGSWVAARFALDYPDRVDKLVLMSAAGLLATQSNMQRIRSERTQAVDNPTWESIKAMFVNLIAEEGNRAPDLIALRQAIYRLPEMKQAIHHILALQDPEVRERNLISEQEWEQITAPAFVVASGKDHNEYENTSRRVASLMPNAQLFEMPHVRHWPHFEDPQTFNRASLEFLTAERD